MQAFITEELIWALHRERVEDARRVWLASQAPEPLCDDKPCAKGPSRWVPLIFRPAAGR